MREELPKVPHGSPLICLVSDQVEKRAEQGSCNMRLEVPDVLPGSPLIC